MTNAELIKALRYCPSHGCGRCDALDENGKCKVHGIAGMMESAADALEAAEKRIARLEEDLKTREAEREVMQDTIKRERLQCVGGEFR